MNVPNRQLACEIICRDEKVYQKLLMQSSEFNELAKPFNLNWPDVEAKTKKIICVYPYAADLFSANKYPKYIAWMLDTGITLREIVKLFLEDMDIGKGQAPDEVKDPTTVFCKSRTIIAQGKYWGKIKGFEICEGSEVRLSTNAYGTAQKKRAELLEKGTIKKITENKGVLTKSIICTTPSLASDIVLGGSNNGWITWRDAQNNTLDKLYRNK